MSQDKLLSHHLLAQSSINQIMPFDLLEELINRSIQYVKSKNINARISNIILDVKGKITLAQIYVERQNGFAPTKENRYGTSPVSYRIQIRFPYGLEIALGGELMFLPPGDFIDILPAYFSESSKKICDDVQRDWKCKNDANEVGDDLVYDQNKIKVEFVEKNRIRISCIQNEQEWIEFPLFSGHSINARRSDPRGLGYTLIPGADPGEPGEYIDLADYNLSLKQAGVYPLFYTSFAESNRFGLLRFHDEYPGFTSSAPRITEPQDGREEERKNQYRQMIQNMHEAIVKSAPGVRWMSNLVSPKGAPLIFEFLQINGIKFWKNGLPITRLRDYQLELLYQCCQFIKNPQQQTISLIAAATGAGKTHIIYSLLEYLKINMEEKMLPMAPSFCMAPTQEIAEVIATAINRQGLNTGTSAMVVSSVNQLPDDSFMSLYHEISDIAVSQLSQVNAFLDQGLQEFIINYCAENHLHFTQIINLLFNTYNDNDLFSRLEPWKDSVDPKRLLLLVLGQQTIRDKAGMIGIYALKQFFEQLEAIKDGLDKDHKSCTSLMSDLQTLSSLKKKFAESTMNAPITDKQPSFLVLAGFEVNIDYNQTLSYRNINFNLAVLDSTTLNKIIEQKFRTTINLRGKRDNLIKIACLLDKEAAILLANSGGLGNTYKPEQLREQIGRYLPIAARQISMLASKKELSIEEHYILYLCLNELFTGIPEEISLWKHLKKGQPGQKNKDTPEKIKSDFYLNLYYSSLEKNINIVEFLIHHVQQCLKSLTKIKDFKSHYHALQQRFGAMIHPEMTLIEVVDRLTGIAGLQIVGDARGDHAKLLLSHVPVFTPEGFDRYLDLLTTLKDKNKVQFKAGDGLYALNYTSDRVTRQDIQQRMQQISSACMIADEVHKDEFCEFYDPSKTIYKSIQSSVASFLNRPFVLSRQLWMSATHRTYPMDTKLIFELSIQKMIQQKLVKACTIVSKDASETDEDYAQQVIVDYFSSNIFWGSQGIFFSRQDNPILQQFLQKGFNLLIQEPEEAQRVEKQQALYETINKNRTSKPLQRQEMQQAQQKILSNRLISLYIEYILTKSAFKKEYADIIGLQNQLFAKNVYWSDLSTMSEENIKRLDATLGKLLKAIEQVEPQCITQEDIIQFISKRLDLNHHELKALYQTWIAIILMYKNQYQKVMQHLHKLSASTPIKQFITTERALFEAGLAIVMIGSEGERTGYSYEPLGLVFDIPTNRPHRQVDAFVQRSHAKSVTPEDIYGFLSAVYELMDATYAYDEKMQAGGRALRTPFGEALFLEYHTKLNASIPDFPWLVAFQVESSFNDIFTSEESKANQARKSIIFNREVLRLLKENQNDNLNQFVALVASHFAKELEVQPEIYKVWITERIKILWWAKYQANKLIDLINVQRCHDQDEKEIIENVLHRKKLPSRPTLITESSLYKTPLSSSSGGAENRNEHDQSPLSFAHQICFSDGRGKEESASKRIIPCSDRDDIIRTTSDGHSSNQKAHAEPFHQKQENNLPLFQEQFDVLLNELKIKTGELINKKHLTRYKAVADKAYELQKNLDQLRNDFFFKKKMKFSDFYSKCVRCINDAKNEFSLHRGYWATLDYRIKGFLGVVAGLTIILGLMAAVFAPWGFMGTFFYHPPTDSAKKLKSFESGLEELKPQSLS